MSAPAFIPVADAIALMQTPAGGWTRATLAKLGVAWPPPKGWRERLEDSELYVRVGAAIAKATEQ